MRSRVRLLVVTAALIAAGAPLVRAADAAADFERAERYFAARDYVNAAQVYRAVVEADPRGPFAGPAAFRVGMCQFALGEYDAAVLAFKKFEEGFPTSAYYDDAVFLSAQAYFRMGEAHQAFERLLRVVAFGSGNRYYDRAVRGIGNLADQSLTAEQLRKRLEDYYHSPAAAKILLKLGKHEASRGAFDKAVVLFDAVIRDYPGTAEAEDAQAAAAAAREKVGRESFVLGALLPLSGECEVYGRAIRAGIEIAVDENNARHPEAPITVAFEDSAAPGGAADAAQRLIFQSRAIALVGPALTDDVRAVAPLCESYQIPAVSPAATDGSLSRLNGYVYVAGLTFEAEAGAMAAYATKHLGIKRFAILYPNNAYGRDMKAAFAAAVADLGGTVAGEVEYPVIDMTLEPDKREINYSPFTKKVKWAHADAVYLPGHYDEVVRLLPQLTFSDVTAYLLGTNGWNENRVIRVGAKYVEGAYFTAAFFADDPDVEVRNFAAAYRRKTADFPNYLAAQGYDAARIVCGALYPRAHDGAEVKARLDGVKNYHGITGTTTLRGPDGTLVKDVVILTVREGEVALAPQ
jgi:branched-chain amino acid transport system substrate-binding protein